MRIKVLYFEGTEVAGENRRATAAFFHVVKIIEDEAGAHFRYQIAEALNDLGRG